MKVKVLCSVTFVWEVDSQWYPDLEEPTKQTLLDQINRDADEDCSPIFECETFVRSQIMAID